MTNIVEIEEKIELLRATLYELVQQNSSDKKILHISQSLDKLLNEYDKKKALKE
ncbi:Spo0E family sporulation regulatory protein-aspartic acid phosphatase [Radiobacillus sp. PE A8.2]|uniref:Spo0E family sporulation regulatory protein-aspartic acid phosphatase n=1 Tax=Radiobacillus sp. PE A8.2 TaxID=3380349 RepID=UPI00388FA926